MRGTISKTLVIRFSSVGDILLSTLLVRVLRRRFPQAQIDYLVKARHAELLRGNPHLSRVLTLPDGASFREMRRLRAQVRAERYDLIFDIHDSLRSRFVCAGHPAVRRYRKRRFARWLLIHAHRDVYRWFGGAPGVAERYLEPAAEYGIVDDGGGLEVFPGPEDVAAAADAVQGLPPGTLVGVCPTARHQTKMWPPESFARAACLLARIPGIAAVVLLGGPDDRERCAGVAQSIRAIDAAIPVRDASGGLSLLASAALLDRCAVVLTNDSGLMHLASARHRPVVAVFGPTVRQLGFFPTGTRAEVVEHPDLACRPCSALGSERCPQSHFRCMLDIPAERVADAARRLLAV
jgi:heptosyltransferase-2